MRKTQLLAACILTICITQGAIAEIISPDRRIEWTTAGIPGGTPNRTIICSTINAQTYGNNATDATNAIQDALDTCPANQVVFLPEGVYKVSPPANSNTILNMRDNTTIRGAGPGKTIISFAGDYARSMIDIRGSVYNDIFNQERSFDIISGMEKDSRQITLAASTGISVGDILLIDQLNDPQLVDPVGHEGLCNHCGRKDGTRARGQWVEIIGKTGNTITMNLPLYWSLNSSLMPQATLANAQSMVRGAGIEDLTLTESQPAVEFMIEMDGAQYSWVRNVEITRVNRRAIWLIESLQNEIRDCYIHDAIGGFGRDRGYGVLIDAYSSANLVENNIFKTMDGGGVMAAGGASGNVVAYNYMTDARFDDAWWLTCAPSISHATHPSMNLWEGNVGVQAVADFIHGSSSHNTIYRSRFSGWQNETSTANNNAIELQYKNTYMNILGCILGTEGKSSTYEVSYPDDADNSLMTIWRLGYGGVDWAGDTNVKATLLRHGNFDYVTDSVAWDPTIADHNLPASLYRESKPSWFGNVPWPPIGPDVAGYVNKIPAELRFEGSNGCIALTNSNLLDAMMQYRSGTINIKQIIEVISQWKKGC